MFVLSNRMNVNISNSVELGAMGDMEERAGVEEEIIMN